VTDALEFRGETTSWRRNGEILEVRLHRAPCNEIGMQTLTEWERLTEAIPGAFARGDSRAILLWSETPAGFGAGADLRELYTRMQGLGAKERRAGIREFLGRIHRVMATLDESPIPTVAAVHGVVFGGGFELALTMDLLVADRTARFGFPELRLGLVPGFGGIPRLKRELGNGQVRDLLLTGRTLGADRAHEVGLVARLAAEGRALDIAGATAKQLAKFDRVAAGAAKRFVKHLPREDMELEIEIFTDLFLRPVVEDALRDFVARRDPLPYLPPE
jgi:enoyl-CoA hydratase/carnithine racemase